MYKCSNSSAFIFQKMNALIAERWEAPSEDLIFGNDLYKIFIFNKGALIIKNIMIKRTGLLLAFFFQVSLALYGQADGPGTIYNKFPAVSGEQVRLFTDRNIYCVNEKICFTAEYSCTVMPESLSLSKVLYFELISFIWASLAPFQLISSK